MLRTSQIFALIAIAFAAQVSSAFECYEGDVDAKSVVSLRAPAKLYMLAPNRDDETGKLDIVNAAGRASSGVQWIAGQPITYVFDAVPGEFIRGSLPGGGTSLIVRKGMFSLIKEGSYHYIVVDESGKDHEYTLKMMSDADCAKVFPPNKRN